MRVLVTGHLGYIGSVMVPLLEAAGHEVVGLDSGFFDDCRVDDPAPANTIAKDIREVTPEDLDGFEAVVHLAALSNDPLGSLDPELTYEINFGGGLKLAAAAQTAGVERFLFASSCSLYGASGSAPADESAPLAPITPYAETKAWLERALLALTSDSFSPVMLRNATAHGWSPRLRGDLVVHDRAGDVLDVNQRSPRGAIALDQYLPGGHCSSQKVVDH
jgi:nucleoside-diphosphate-sugar epimerase